MRKRKDTVTLLSFFSKRIRERFEELEKILLAADKRGINEITGEEAKNFVLAVGELFIWLNELCSYLGVSMESCVSFALKSQFFEEGGKVMYEILCSLKEHFKEKEKELKEKRRIREDVC